MQLLSYLAAGIFAASPALLVSAGVAETGSGEHAVSGQLVQLAQAATDEPADAEASDSQTAEEGAEEEAPAFTEDVLTDPARIATGGETWVNICQGCHGANAYPGKAPKLRPKRYEPAFVFDRVTNGYKGMPSWKDVLTLEERTDVVTYILSKEFSP